MSERQSEPRWSTAERSIHILPASATMVGVCMTVLSVSRLADDGVFALGHLVAVASVLFLGSSFCAYFAIRGGGRSRRAELVAEWFFLAGLVLATAAGLLIAIELPG
jgi:hypothetical protein